MEKEPVNNQTTITTPSESPSSKSGSKVSKLKEGSLVKMIAVSVFAFALGVGLTSAGALAGIVGKKYSSSELESAKDASREEGIADGYSSGQSAGYKSGLLDGCNYVFTKLDTNDVIKIVYPYNRLSVIAPYWSKSTLCQ
jgi:hypothetical protein